MKQLRTHIDTFSFEKAWLFKVVRTKPPLFPFKLFTEHSSFPTLFNLSGTTFINEQFSCLKDFSCIYSREAVPAWWKKSKFSTSKISQAIKRTQALQTAAAHLQVTISILGFRSHLCVLSWFKVPGPTPTKTAVPVWCAWLQLFSKERKEVGAWGRTLNLTHNSGIPNICFKDIPWQCWFNWKYRQHEACQRI